MDRETHDRIVETYWAIREQARSDPEYLRLQASLKELEGRYESILAALPEEQRLVIELYITCRESMNSRMLEFACEKLTRLH